MRALVTGGAGFIGHHLVGGLLSRGHDVSVIDDFSTGQHSRLTRFGDAVNLIEASILDAATLDAAVAGCEVIFHAPEIIHSGPGPLPDVVPDAVGRHAFTVGFVGTLGTANAIDSLVEAARLLADEDIGVVIAGHGPEAGRLRDLASNLPNVVFIGPVAKAHVPSVLAALDACYVGYRRSALYGFGISPNKVFDYMAARRPVILAASAPNDPVAEAGCGLTVEPDDPARLAAAILAIRAKTREERDRLGASGRTYVERVHGYDRLAEAYEQVLESTG